MILTEGGNVVRGLSVVGQISAPVIVVDLGCNYKNIKIRRLLTRMLTNAPVLPRTGASGVFMVLPARLTISVAAAEEKKTPN
jgi:hypothetical protein